MKKFEIPEVQIEVFEFVDVIATSTGTDTCENDCMSFDGCVGDLGIG